MSSALDYWISFPIAGAVAKFTLLRNNGSGTWANSTKGQAPDAIATVGIDATTFSLMTSPIYAIAGELLMKGKIRILQASGAIPLLAAPMQTPVYSDDAGLITATNTGYRIGYALEAATANGDQIAIQLDPAFVGVIGELAAPTAAAVGLVAETVMATITLPPNTLAVGDVIDITALLVASGNGADTTQIRVRLGGLTGTVIADTTAIATVAANTPAAIQASMVVEALGSGTNGKIDGGSLAPFFKAIAAPISAGRINIDTTISQTIVLTIIHGSANAGNTAVANQFTAKRAKAA